MPAPPSLFANDCYFMLNNLIIRDRCFDWGQRTYLMGILNVTPDSFSDGGDFKHPTAALVQARAMVTAGADIIDIGGQSTRPGAKQISVTEELDRVLTVLQLIRSEISLPISIDTTRAAVAKASVSAGADIINDISGGTFDSEMFSVVAELNVPIVLMHIRGTPETMHQQTDYQDLMAEIYSFLSTQITKAMAAGITNEKIVIDPGIGFAKNDEQNLEIFRRLQSLTGLNCPILVATIPEKFSGSASQPTRSQS